MLFELHFFCHDDLYCCVKHSNVEYQVEIFKTHIIKSDAQKQMIDFGSECRFHDLRYFEVEIFFAYSLNSLST